MKPITILIVAFISVMTLVVWNVTHTKTTWVSTTHQITYLHGGISSKGDTAVHYTYKNGQTITNTFIWK